MRFIRFVLSHQDVDSGVASGPFEVAYRLRESADVDGAERDILAGHLAWFEKHLETPTRFNRTSSKGYYRKQARGISWLKDTAAEHLARLHEIAIVLERHGHSVMLVSEARVGYVVYEDDFQVVAEPFADTRTR